MERGSSYCFSLCRQMRCPVRVALGTTNSWFYLAARRIVATSLLVLFFAANYAVQTHIHETFAGAPTATDGAILSVPSPIGPGDNDTQHCPLCQEFLSGGNFLLSTVPSIALPLLTDFAFLPLFVEFFTAHVAHDWQSRGPPQA